MTDEPLSDPNWIAGVVPFTWTCLRCGCTVADGFRDLHAVTTHPKAAVPKSIPERLYLAASNAGSSPDTAWVMSKEALKTVGAACGFTVRDEPGEVMILGCPVVLDETARPDAVGIRVTAHSPVEWVDLP